MNAREKQVRETVEAEFSDLKAKAQSNLDYAMAHIKRIGGTRAEAAATAFYHQASIANQLALMAIVTISVSDMPDTGIDVAKKLLGSFQGISRDFAEVILLELVESREHSTQCFNILAELINRENDLFSTAVANAIEAALLPKRTT